MNPRETASKRKLGFLYTVYIFIKDGNKDKRLTDVTGVVFDSTTGRHESQTSYTHGFKE